VVRVDRCGARSDGVGEFGEGCGDPMPAVDIATEFVAHPTASALRWNCCIKDRPFGSSRASLLDSGPGYAT
jgi:hypothetical protein